MSLDVGSRDRDPLPRRRVRELVALTPGDYIHLGGDEVEGMDHEAYVRFMWDACTLVLRHGKTPIVWEEAGVAKLPEGTIVQHWSDAAPARAGAAQGLPLIMSPAPHTYLDQKYDESTELGLTWAGAVEVRDAYEWDPARGHRGRGRARRRGRAVDGDHRDARRRRLDGLPAPGRGRRGRLVRARATGRTSGRAWPPTARCCASSA